MLRPIIYINLASFFLYSLAIIRAIGIFHISNDLRYLMDISSMVLPFFVLITSSIYQSENQNFSGYGKSLFIPLSYMILGFSMVLFLQPDGIDYRPITAIESTYTPTFFLVIIVNLIILIIYRQKIFDNDFMKKKLVVSSFSVLIAAVIVLGFFGVNYVIWSGIPRENLPMSEPLSEPPSSGFIR